MAFDFDAFAVAAALRIGSAGSGAGPATAGGRAFQTFGTGVITVAVLAFLGVAAIDAKGRALAALTKGSAGGAGGTSRITAVTSFVTTSIALAAETDQPFLARATHANLAAGCGVGQSISAQTDITTSVFLAVVTRRTVSTSLAAISTVSVDHAEVRVAIGVTHTAPAQTATLPRIERTDRIGVVLAQMAKGVADIGGGHHRIDGAVFARVVDPERMAELMHSDALNIDVATAIGRAPIAPLAGVVNFVELNIGVDHPAIGIRFGSRSVAAST